MDVDAPYVAECYVDDGPTCRNQTEGQVWPPVSASAQAILISYGGKRRDKRAKVPGWVRLGEVKSWDSNWYANKQQYGDLLHEDWRLSA